MTPKPIAIGLLLCDRVIVDKDTNSPSAIGMGNSPVFDYNQPTRVTLAGIFVEASDKALEQTGGAENGSPDQIAPHPAALFGVTVTADDRANAKQANGLPASHGSAFSG